ncbi:hypothetical protein CFOL_v3_18553 [Cephalotus follicularis]|uniref:Uncharacterized protein n=1 Tax=Cephalotus follicularis TaxID=3775 RepID=A0A1Q3C4A3_CEPFO|nr:hypothetical protein CFOL_v3_18553 [Cephalotus follicularis]
MEVTAFSCFNKVCIKKCFVLLPCNSLLQTLTVPSAEPVNTIDSNPATTAFIASSCALMDSKHLESDILHTFRVLSHDPEYSNPCSSFKLKLEIASKCLILSTLRFLRTCT